MNEDHRTTASGIEAAGQDIDALLPLQPMHFRVSLVLAAGPLHGYAIAKELERAHGSPVLPGNLYRTLKQMRAKRLIHEAAPEVENDDERRRYFELTELGKEVAAAETGRMEALVEAAHRARLAAPGNESAS